MVDVPTAVHRHEGLAHLDNVIGRLLPCHWLGWQSVVEWRTQLFHRQEVRVPVVPGRFEFDDARVLLGEEYP